MKKILIPCLFLACFLLVSSVSVFAQTAKLSVQGILKKANGNAVDDGQYSLTFKLYNIATGGTALWTETQTDVEVASGIYTVTLGSVTTLNIPFNETYYLGVTVGGSTEMQPRIQLTTAPYALSLIGSSNQFPSSGTVKADNMTVTGKMGVGTTALPPATGQPGGVTMWVDGGIRVNGGAPAANNTTNRGYTFVNNSGDNDSGLFSTADGVVSLYANATEYLKVSATSPQVNIKGNGLIDNSLTVADQLSVNGRVSSNLTMNNQKNLAYFNGTATNNDWRLVDRNDFAAGSDGWSATSDLTNQTLNSNLTETVSYGTFNGNVFRSSSNNANVLKKQFNLSAVGPYTHVKIKFKYYFTDSWDADQELGYGGFQTALNTTPVICWSQPNFVLNAGSNASYTGNTQFSDAATYGEMVAATSATSFYVFFGMRDGGEGLNNERFAIGNIEVWVR